MVHLTPLALDLTLRGRAETVRFDRRCRDPQAVQAAVLRRLLRRNASTKFGQEHRFASITGPAQYASQIPVREYEALRPWVDQAAAGTPDVLTADPVMMFTRTSGTTGTRWVQKLGRHAATW
jgi:GH3 auxin-responsive promoter